MSVYITFVLVQDVSDYVFCAHTQTKTLVCCSSNGPIVGTHTSRRSVKQAVWTQQAGTKVSS
jgi:hypothetical protein